MAAATTTICRRRRQRPAVRPCRQRHSPREWRRPLSGGAARQFSTAAPATTAHGGTTRIPFRLRRYQQLFRRPRQRQIVDPPPTGRRRSTAARQLHYPSTITSSALHYHPAPSSYTIEIALRTSGRRRSSSRLHGRRRCDLVRSRATTVAAQLLQGGTALQPSVRASSGAAGWRRHLVPMVQGRPTRSDGSTLAVSRTPLPTTHRGPFRPSTIRTIGTEGENDQLTEGDDTRRHVGDDRSCARGSDFVTHTPSPIDFGVTAPTIARNADDDFIEGGTR